MKVKEIHLDVYKEKSVLHYENSTEKFAEGPQSKAAQKRYQKIMRELDNGFLEKIYDEPFDENADALSEDNIRLLTNLVDKLTSEVGRSLNSLAFLQLVIKTISPKQSVRLHKAGAGNYGFKWVEGVSMRTLDRNYTIPFLRRKNLLSINADGSFMTRSLAENYPYSRLYKAEMRGPFVEWISIVDAIEDGTIPPRPALKYLIMLLKNKAETFKSLADETVTLAQKNIYQDFNQTKETLINFFETTRYSARAYEVVMHSFLQAIFEIKDTDLQLQPMTQMRSANKKHGNIGDIEIKEGQVICEAWDAKFGKTYLYDELDELSEKIGAGNSISIAGFVVDKDLRMDKDIEEKIAAVEQATDTEIRLFNFSEWIDFKLEDYEISTDEEKNEVGRRWMLAVVESFAQKRRKMAPIDEPCDEWLINLKEILIRKENEAVKQPDLFDEL